MSTLENHKDKIMQMIRNGATNKDICMKYNVSKSTFVKFKNTLMENTDDRGANKRTSE